MRGGSATHRTKQRGVDYSKSTVGVGISVHSAMWKARTWVQFLSTLTSGLGFGPLFSLKLFLR